MKQSWAPHARRHAPASALLLHGLAIAAVVVAVLVGNAGRVEAQEADAEASTGLDINVFSQGDAGGQQYRTESFDYVGVRFALKLPLDEIVTWRGNVAVAYIANHTPKPLPASITNANVMSASPDLLTLDTALTLDIKPPESDWTISPGIFYHHQKNHASIGLDLEFSLDLFDGNTVLALTYGFRFDYLWLQFWDNSSRPDDTATTHNLMIGITQIVSPQWKLNLSFQYTRQDGFLSDPYGYVTIENASGDPILLTDEDLPRTRNRGQLNLRARFSPELGVAVGLDTSVYADDWGIWHAAFEPSVELPVASLNVRWRVWYRIAIQRETRYFRRAPTTVSEFQTQDSDLGRFVMHGPGMLVNIRLNGGANTHHADDDGAGGGNIGNENGNGKNIGTEWRLRVSVFGFARDDGIFAVGGSIGATATW